MKFKSLRILTLCMLDAFFAFLYAFNKVLGQTSHHLNLSSEIGT